MKIWLSHWSSVNLNNKLNPWFMGPGGTILNYQGLSNLSIQFESIQFLILAFLIGILIFLSYLGLGLSRFLFPVGSYSIPLARYVFFVFFTINLYWSRSLAMSRYPSTSSITFSTWPFCLSLGLPRGLLLLGLFFKDILRGLDHSRILNNLTLLLLKIATLSGFVRRSINSLFLWFIHSGSFVTVSLLLWFLELSYILSKSLPDLSTSAFFI